MKRLEDIKGLKIRTPSREMSGEALKEMGAVPMPIPGLGMTEADDARRDRRRDGAVVDRAGHQRQVDVATSHTEGGLQPAAGSGCS